MLYNKSAEDTDMTFTATYDDSATVGSLSIGGNTLDESMYTLEGDKLTVSCHCAKTLCDGEYEICINFTDGTECKAELDVIGTCTEIEPDYGVFNRVVGNKDVIVSVINNTVDSYISTISDSVTGEIDPSNYSYENGTLTIFAEYFTDFQVGEYELTITMSDNTCAVLPVYVIADVLVVFPRESTFSKANPRNIRVLVFAVSGETVESLKIGGITVNESNYTVNGVLLTINSEYFMNKTNGVKTFTVTMTNKATAEFNVKVTD